MRRTGLVLAGLGAFLIVFALLQAFWVTGQVIKFPLNQYASVTLADPNATYFSAANCASSKDFFRLASFLGSLPIGLRTSSSSALSAASTLSRATFSAA